MTMINAREIERGTWRITCPCGKVATATGTAGIVYRAAASHNEKIHGGAYTVILTHKENHPS